MLGFEIIKDIGWGKLPSTKTLKDIIILVTNYIDLKDVLTVTVLQILRVLSKQLYCLIKRLLNNMQFHRIIRNNNLACNLVHQETTHNFI